MTSGGDLDVSTGNLVLTTDVNVITAQKLTSRFQLVLGEWFADARIGVPYFQLVLVKNPNLGVIRQLFRQVILTTPGVNQILSDTPSYNPAARTLAWAFQVQTIQGAVLTGGPGVPFIVTVSPSGAPS